jgi:hypothetical protein
MLPFGRVASLSIFPCLKNSLDYWIPHHQSDSWQPPHGVCLIMGDEDDRTVSGFVLHPLGRPGLPYFQSSYPWVWERSCILPSPPPFPPWHIFFPHHMPRRHVPSIVPSLRSIGEIITVVDSGLFSHWPPHQVHSAPFDALPLPLSSVCPGNLANHCSSLKKLKPVLAPLPSQSSYSHGPALLCLVDVPRAGNLPEGGRSKGKWRRSCDGGALLFAAVGFCN